MNQTAQKILDVAERMMREGGYHSFSYRQIADELGIKSASIHYHFPAKEDLGLEVTRRYMAHFMDGLGRPEDLDAPLDHYMSAFESSLEQSQCACLCGVLAAEAGRLPGVIVGALSGFAAENQQWLESALRKQNPEWAAKRQRSMSLILFSALEGAMIFATLVHDPDHLANVVGSLRELTENAV